MKLPIVLAAATAFAGPLALAPQTAPAAGCTYPASGDILAAWSRLGGETGSLGCPRETQHAGTGIAGSLVQKFEHGEISATPSFSPHMTLAVYIDVAKEMHVVWNNVTTNYGSLMIGTLPAAKLGSPRFVYRTVPYVADGSAEFTMATSLEDAYLVGCPSQTFANRLVPAKPCNTSAQDGGDITQSVDLTIAMAPPPPPPAPVVNEISLPFPNLTFKGDTPVNAYAYLTLYQNGTVQYSGHFHDSGAPSYSTEMVCGVVSADGVAFTATHKGSISGTPVLGGSRDDDWNEPTTNAAITSDWAALVKSHPATCEYSVNADVGGMLSNLVSWLNTALSLPEGLGKVITLFSDTN